MNKELLLAWATKLDETPDLIQSPWVCQEFYFDIPESTRLLFLMTPLGLLSEQLEISQYEWKAFKALVDNNKFTYHQVAEIIRFYVQS